MFGGPKRSDSHQPLLSHVEGEVRASTRLLDFFHATGRMKKVPRQGWVDRGVPHAESVADHTYRSAMMAWVLGEAAGLDTARLVKLVLVHDLAESEVGDLTPYADALGTANLAGRVAHWRDIVSADQVAAAKQTKRQLEANAADRLWELLPSPLGAEMAALWNDYAAGTTPEARFAAQIDKVEALLQAIEYRDAGHPSDVENFIVTAREAVEHPLLLALLRDLEARAATQVSRRPS